MDPYRGPKSQGRGMYPSADFVSCLPNQVVLPHSEENCNSATPYFVTVLMFRFLRV